jgi:hypothetical protein
VQAFFLRERRRSRRPQGAIRGSIPRFSSHDGKRVHLDANRAMFPISRRIVASDVRAAVLRRSEGDTLFRWRATTKKAARRANIAASAASH